ncbi:YidC/Oxa1 family membrane protein insertase [Oscillibacter sp. PC13]|uniref:YidC/Oxa1 family membrane protein insertase n=1 Tax=Oscillibacter sp. PC13 TaxID=1855299 RepID=UPI0008DECEC4|nr:YidC/Oxa1 family membrane protein insertase [Oscillibacter sp. PC13]SFP77267.1 YidC/Oxa1 family membrane protein insertase [Oscillibacter sp. PC13]
MFSTIGYWICIPFAAILRLFYNLTGSYGMSLILFTLVIKLILLPFQMKSKKSMIRMSRMSGKMQEIQKKYANNQLKMQEEMQRFYQEEGINPMSGCLWSFLPMPILLALYYIIREPIVYFMNFGGREAGREVLEAARTLIQNAGITLSSNSVYEQIEISNIINSKFPEFAAEHAGWVNVDYHFLGIDLTAMPTSAFSALKEGFSLVLIGLILIPIISGALSLLLSKISMNQSGTQNTAGGAQMKMMMWMMPLMSVYIGFILPAALGIYWIAQSAFSIIQELILGKFYNEKLQAEEDAREQARQADRQKRMEEAKILQEQQRQQASQKQSLRDKRKAAEAAKAAKAKKAAFSTTEAGRVGDRPYARGRSFKEDRYDDNETK